MKVRVDEQRCQGHTQCNFTAPELFGLRDEDGHSFARHEQVPPGMDELARLAAESCPEQAIVITEE